MKRAYQRPSARKLSADGIFSDFSAQYLLDFRQCPDTGISNLFPGGTATLQNNQLAVCATSPQGTVTAQCQETGGTTYSILILSATPGGGLSCPSPSDPTSFIITVNVTPTLPSTCTVTSFVTGGEDPDACQ